ncbi:uncharacterized protein LOC110853481 [Folsomia candida]|uniref:Lectin BRA-3 n=1 Tax=Folsomia candida TaxID=158441 RepID=A0A226E008_FOLCA|nr:uncharacterized protein LOC110853481 [Folsomia candida]OXA50588.1 Lectin BRA-3 [Folsomia candida]
MALLKLVLWSMAVVVFSGVAVRAATLDRQIEYPEMRVIGTIGSKTFYTTLNSTFQVRWDAARQICRQSGIQFAIFQSDAEFDFVRANVAPSSQLWIDASMREMETLTGRAAFVYGDGSDVSTKNVMIHPANWVCLYFSADDHIFSGMCAEQRGVLCHMNNADGTNSQ